jgi:DNA-binding NtrC family response regulator
MTAAALRILVVDDEPNVVNSVRRELMLAQLGNYVPVVEVFTDTDEALQRAREVEFGIVLTDFRMPKRNGLEFLKELQSIQPWIEAIVLSGDTDIDSLVKMINDTHIYRFIPKPWRPQVLRNTIVQAAELRRASVRHRKLAGILASSGIGFVNRVPDEPDTVLIIDEDLGVANAIKRDLVQTNLLFDILGTIDFGKVPGASPVLDSSRLRVQVATNAADALSATRTKEPVACIIADYLTGEPEGMALLADIAQHQPDAALLVWSESPSMDALIGSLDVARIQCFISKPSTSHELRSVVAQALAHRRIHLDTVRLAEHLSRLGQSAIGT